MTALSILENDTLKTLRNCVLNNEHIESPPQPVNGLERIYEAFLQGKTEITFPSSLPFLEKLEATLLMLAIDKSNEQAREFLSSCISSNGITYLHGFEEAVDPGIVVRITTNNPKDSLQEQVMAHLFEKFELQECVQDSSKHASFAQHGRNVPLFTTQCQGISLMGAPSAFPLLTKETFGVFSDKKVVGCAPFLKDSTVGWVHWDSSFAENEFSFTARFVAEEVMYPLAFTLLVKADLVEIDDYGIVSKASLDKYHGSISHLFVTQQENVLRIDAKGGCEMQVIPLAGGDAFWGADYMIAYVAEGPGDTIQIQGKGIK